MFHLDPGAALNLAFVAKVCRFGRNNPLWSRAELIRLYFLSAMEPRNSFRIGNRWRRRAGLAVENTRRAAA